MKLKLLTTLAVLLIPILIAIRFIAECYLENWNVIFAIQIFVFLLIINIIYKLIKSL